MAKWFVSAKKADFNRIGEKYQISPVLARIIRNRDIIEDCDIEKFLYGKLEDIPDGSLLKDMDEAVPQNQPKEIQLSKNAVFIISPK